MISNRALILGLFALCFVAVFCDKQKDVPISFESAKQLSETDVVKDYVVGDFNNRVKRAGSRAKPLPTGNHLPHGEPAANDNNNNNNNNQGGFRQRGGQVNNVDRQAADRARENARRQQA